MRKAIVRHKSKLLPAEAKVFQFLQERGYFVGLGKWYEGKRLQSKQRGIPDFLVQHINSKDKFWVEVKKSNGLTIEQLKWRLRHPKEKVILAIVDDSSKIIFLNLEIIDLE